MPTGLKRYSGHDYLHFLTCSCYHRQPWLASAKRRDLFLQIFEEVRERYRFVVVGYVAMPNHIHLLISEPERGTPSTIMQVVKQGLVQEPEQWRWSSYRSYAYGEPGMVKINLWPKAELRQRPAA
jgi:putative transposase